MNEKGFGMGKIEEPILLYKSHRDFLKNFKKWSFDILTKLSRSFMEKEIPLILKDCLASKELIIKLDEIININLSLKVDGNAWLIIRPIISDSMESLVFDKLSTFDEVYFKRNLEIKYSLEILESCDASLCREILNCAFTYLYLGFKSRIFSYKESKRAFDKLINIGLLYHIDVSSRRGTIEKLNNLFDKSGENFFKQVDKKDFKIFL